MKRSSLTLVAFITISIAAASVTAATPGGASRYELLSLHVEDAVAAPGGRVAVVFRAYASRPIGQGQVCFVAQPPPDAQEPPPSQPPAPLSYSDSLVFSAAGDALIEFDQIDEHPPTFVLRFVSPSASVNLYDGPLAVVFFDLHPDVAPGSMFDLRLDVEGTHVFDEDGVPIAILPLDGKLDVRAAADPFAVSIDAGRVTPDSYVDLAVHTFEPAPWVAGRLGVRYDPEVLEGAPVVRMDPRHGAATFVHDVSTPGLLIVDFQSAGGVLNTVPGQLVRLALTTARSARPTSTSRVWLDPALTWVEGLDGQLLPLVLEEDSVEILPPGRGAQGLPDRPFTKGRAAEAPAP